MVGSAGCRSRCEPFRAIIIECLERGLSAQRIWQDLRSEHGFAESYQSVQRFVRHLRSATPLPFRRMECEPGEEAQIDFGTGAPVITSDAQRRRRRTHVFRIVLSHSRKGYSESVFRQTTEEFIRCIENALQHFGGVPKTLVIDNLKAAVTKADWYDPDINPKIQAFCEHYGTVILPTRPQTPRHKGKVEKGVDYVQSNALKGRAFSNLQDQNQHLLDWESHVADTRIHGTTRKQVGKVFKEVERPTLQPLPTERFPFFHEAERRVHRDGHVAVDKAYYSVPRNAA
ncbi:MAG: IS21 family transposase [Planctomycetota bacterium]